jgi:acyl-CoA synthetase (AMP-forming)/AMP-acid ligase II
VALASPVEVDELAAFAAERLAGYKRPRKIVVVDALPRLLTGKMRRGVLREWAAALAVA